MNFCQKVHDTETNLTDRNEKQNKIKIDRKVPNYICHSYLNLH